MKRNTENDQRKGGKEDVDRDRKGASVGAVSYTHLTLPTKLEV